MRAILQCVIFISFAGAMLSAAPRREREFVLIVHPSNKTSAIKRKTAGGMFLKKIVTWESGVRVAPVDLPATSGLRDRFSRTVHGKPTAAIRSYWQQQVFSGRGTPPAELANDGEVLAWVRRHEGAIGYVDKETKLDGVEAVAVVD
jgi:ABC-type phosphate transport system substrate-binding protein